VAKTEADKYATVLFNAATRFFPNWKMRVNYSDEDPDKESQFYLLKHTVCPAILSENFFMDNETDCRYIMTKEGRQQVADMHVSAFKKMIE
jgi:N-acetylmuramoyl-L-alanine amidase